MKLIIQPYPSSWLSFKPMWLPSQLSSFFVAPSSWGHVKTCQCPKGKDVSHHLDDAGGAGGKKRTISLLRLLTYVWVVWVWDVRWSSAPTMGCLDDLAALAGDKHLPALWTRNLHPEEFILASVPRRHSANACSPVQIICNLEGFHWVTTPSAGTPRIAHILAIGCWLAAPSLRSGGLLLSCPGMTGQLWPG